MMESEDEAAAAFYPRRLAAVKTEYEQVLQRIAWLRNGAGGLLAGLAAAVFGAIRRSVWEALVPGWVLLVILGLLVALILLYLQSLRVRDRLLRLVLHYQRARERLAGTAVQVGGGGEEFRESKHLYEHDLNLLGPGSLFGRLDTVRTGVGQRGLARLLLQADRERTAEELLARRAAIQELTPKNALREQIALLGDSSLQQVPAHFFDGWLKEVPPELPRWLRGSLLATSGLLLVLTGLALAHVLPWEVARPNLLCVFVVQGALALRVRKQVVGLLDGSSRLSNQVAIFREGLGLLQGGSFHAERLQELQRISAMPNDTTTLLGRLENQLVIVEQRTKQWFLVPSLLFCIGTHAALSIAHWKRAYAAAMEGWLEAWAEFEALHALATFAYEHPEYVYPEMLAAGTAVFTATAMAHPLLPEGAVANDLCLDEQNRLYLISGSNMAGKSTLLRAIGVNAVLANTGAPIRARAARMSPMVLSASIALTDSLAEGRSKFLAEVERLHAILGAAQADDGRCVLFLIDEIFSGTNSLDRRIAAEAVTRTLIAHEAIGALSTHDLTLTEMAATEELHATNVHMGSPEAGDPLAFDYRLKPGVNPSSNALAILRMMGIDL